MYYLLMIIAKSSNHATSITLRFSHCKQISWTFALARFTKVNFIFSPPFSLLYHNWFYLSSLFLKKLKKIFFAAPRLFLSLDKYNYIANGGECQEKNCEQIVFCLWIECEQVFVKNTQPPAPISGKNCAIFTNRLSHAILPTKSFFISTSQPIPAFSCFSKKFLI